MNLRLNAQRKGRLFLILWILGFLSAGGYWIYSALQQNLNLYYTPTQLQNLNTPLSTGQPIRVGGMVTVLNRGEGLQVEFGLTDYQGIIQVRYVGILPDLFRVGQGVVVLGQWDSVHKRLQATQVLTKHDERYMPPVGNQ